MESYTSAFLPQKPSMFLSNVSPQSSLPVQKKLPCPLQSAGARFMDFHMVSGDSTDHGYPPCVSKWQYGPWTPTQSPAVAWPRDINIALGGSTDQGHLYSLSQNHGPRHGPPRRQPGPQTSISVASETVQASHVKCSVLILIS